LPNRDPPHDTAAPYVRRWPRAVRLMFLLAAGAASWAVVVLLVWLLWKRVGA